MVHAASSAVSAWGTAVSGGIGMGARCWAVSAWSTMVLGGIGMEYRGVGGIGIGCRGCHGVGPPELF